MIIWEELQNFDKGARCWYLEHGEYMSEIHWSKRTNKYRMSVWVHDKKVGMDKKAGKEIVFMTFSAAKIAGQIWLLKYVQKDIVRLTNFAAMLEVESGKGKKFKIVKGLMKDLNA